MKIPTLLFTILPMIACNTFSQGLGLPDDSSMAGVIDGSLPAPFTEAELAEPPAGKIQLKYLRPVSQARVTLHGIIEAIPTGPEGQGSAEFSKLQLIKAKLDDLYLSHLESDLFDIIAPLAELAQTEQDNTPSFVTTAFGPLQNLSPVFLHVGARHISIANANVQESLVLKLIKLFTVERSLVVEGDWENSNVPFDEPSIMILNPAAVVAQLQTEPWQRAKQFLGGATTASDFFSRYTGIGDGLAVLKTKYAANQSAFDAKFSELKMWADQQEQQAEGGD